MIVRRAPPNAVIRAPASLGSDYGEDEYLVDRRLLGRVVVVERIAQMSMEEYCAANGDAPSSDASAIGAENLNASGRRMTPGVNAKGAARRSGRVSS